MSPLHDSAPMEVDENQQGKSLRKDGIFNMPRAWDKEKISSPSLKFTIVLYLPPVEHFGVADPRS